MNDSLLMVVVCPECGAENDARANQCWLCHANLVQQKKPMRASLVQPQQPAAQRINPPPLPPQLKPQWVPSEHSELWLIAAVTLVLIIVGIGIYAIAKGAVIFYALVVIPAMIATIMRATLKRARGEQLTTSEAVSTFAATGLSIFMSIVVVIAILSLIVVAIVICLVIVCFAVLAGWGR